MSEAPFADSSLWLLPLAESIIADLSCTSARLLLAAFAARQGRPGDLYDFVSEAAYIGCA